MKYKKLAGLLLGPGVGAIMLAACGTSAAPAVSEKELDQQIKTYLDAHMDEYLNAYFSQQEADSQDPAKIQYGDLTKFTAKTLDGGTFTQKNIEEKDVTVLNFWAPGCQNSRSQLPELASLAETLPENVQIVTVYLGDEDKAELEEAGKILKEAGFTGTTLVQGAGDLAAMADKVQYTPTTLFVNKEGKTAETALVGALEPAEFKTTYLDQINALLKAAGQPEIKD